MTCCGKKRINFNIEAHRRASGIAVNFSLINRLSSSGDVSFEYIGETSMVVQGPITGKCYRFEKPGTVVIVDVRDAPSVAQVPNIKKSKI